MATDRASTNLLLAGIVAVLVVVAAVLVTIADVPVIFPILMWAAAVLVVVATATIFLRRPR